MNPNAAMQQFYIAKMMLIFISLFNVPGLPSFKKHNFMEHLSVVASKCSICDTENNTYQFKVCSMFRDSPNGKSLVYGSNEI